MENDLQALRSKVFLCYKKIKYNKYILRYLDVCDMMITYIQEKRGRDVS
jgi:hypothetical protein